MSHKVLDVVIILFWDIFWYTSNEMSRKVYFLEREIYLEDRKNNPVLELEAQP